MQDLVDVFGGISPLLKKFSNPLQGGNGLDILGRLLGPKAPVKIRTDPHVIGIPGQLTDVIGMIEQVLKIQPGPRGVVIPLSQPGTIIQASRAPPITAPLSIRRAICSSEICRGSSTRARQFE